MSILKIYNYCLFCGVGGGNGLTKIIKLSLNFMEYLPIPIYSLYVISIIHELIKHEFE